MLPFDVPESDKITLITADNPPKRYTVSRSRLMLLSGVFRDLLLTSTASPGERDGDITLTERAMELKGLMMVLMEEDGKFAELSQSDWHTFAQVADKYNCSIATKEVVSHTWQLIAEGSNGSAFHLAIELKNEALVQRLLGEAVDHEWYDTESCPMEWRRRMMTSACRRASQVRDLVLGETVTASQCQGQCSSNIVLAWNAAAFRVMQRHKIGDSLENQIRKQFEQPDIRSLECCAKHVAELYAIAKRIDQQLPRAIELVAPGEVPTCVCS